MATGYSFLILYSSSFLDFPLLLLSGWTASLFIHKMARGSDAFLVHSTAADAAAAAVEAAAAAAAGE